MAIRVDGGKIAGAPQGDPIQAGAAASPTILVKDATKVYRTKTGSVHALEGVNLSVYEGEFVCIVGPSGCGKTTLLWAMSGLHGLTRGEVVLDGRPVTGPRPEIGMVFQDANLLPWRTLLQNILLPFEIKRVDPKPHLARIRELLDLVALSGFENKYPRELSGGMQQRTSIVRCLAQDPSVLLMDEPFGALDAFTRDEMNLLILRLWEASRKTVLFVTHNILEAVFLADRVVVMSPRPGRVAGILPVDLPRPRTLEMQSEPRFLSLAREVRELIQRPQ